MTMLISRSADWPRVMISAARINMGTAINDAGRMPPIICWTNVPIWPKPSNIITKPNTAAVISGIIIGKPRSSSPIMIIIIIVAMVNILSGSGSCASDFGFCIGVTIYHTRRQINVFAGEVFDGGQEILDAGDGKTDRCPDVDPPDGQAQRRQDATTAVQGFDVAVGVVAQEEHHHGGEQGNKNHQNLAALGGKGIVNGRHPDVAAVAGSVADAGKGNQDNQDPVDLAGEKQAFSEHKPGNHVNAGVDRHEDNAAGQHDGFNPGNPFINSAQKPGQTGCIGTGIVFHSLLRTLRHGWGTPKQVAPGRQSPRRGGVEPGPDNEGWPWPPPESCRLVFLDCLEVGLELVQQFLTTLAGHLDELVFHLRCPGPEGFDLFFVQTGNGNLVAGSLDLLKGFVGQAVDVYDDFLKREVCGILHQLLVFVRQAVVEILVRHHGGGEPAVAGEDQVRRYFVQSAGLDPEDRVFLALDHVGLQGTVHFTPGQWSGRGTEGRIGFRQKRVGHNPDLLVLELFGGGNRLVDGYYEFTFRVHLQQFQALLGVQLREVFVDGLGLTEEFDHRVHVGGHQVGNEENLGFGNQ